jgi:hypothetical protein
VVVNFANGEADETEKSKSPKLTAAEIEIVGQFNDYSYENPNLTFEQVARKELGPIRFRTHRTAEGSRRNAGKCLIWKD